MQNLEERILYVSGIAPDYERLDVVKQTFLQYGKILKWDFIPKPSVHNPNQFHAIIEYDQKTSADFAVYNLDKKEVNGRKLKVNYKKKEREQKKPIDGQNPQNTNEAQDKDKKTEDKDKKPEEKNKKPEPTVIERPETPVGGEVKSNNQSPSARPKKKVNVVKEVSSPVVELPAKQPTKKTNQKNTNVEQKNDNQAKVETKTETKTEVVNNNNAQTEQKGPNKKTAQKKKSE